MMKLRLLTSAFAIVAVLVGLAPAYGIDAPPPADDQQIVKKLRPEQREYLLVAEREGSAARAVAVAADDTLAAKAPTAAGSVVAESHPIKTVVAAAAQRPDVGQAPASAPQLLASTDTTGVPTSTNEKPSDHPAVALVVNQHDAAWMFAHRFDTPAPNAGPDLNIPGIPVRSQVSSPFDVRSGAFHGVRSVNGFSAVRTRVSIPCASRHFIQGSGFNEVTRQPGPVDQETGYVYIGGWGAGPSGAAVDAGLQKSSAQSVHDDYAFYFKYASNKPITSNLRFKCGGPDVVLELYPVTNSLLVFSATGVVESGKSATITIVQKTKPQDGWVPDGGSRTDGIIIKRIVAIAQPYSWRLGGGPSQTRFTSGSYFGIDSPQDPKPKIVFRRCDIGRVTPPSISPSYQPWTLADTWHSDTPGTYVDWPPYGILREANGVCDSAGIYLKPA